MMEFKDNTMICFPVGTPINILHQINDILVDVYGYDGFDGSWAEIEDYQHKNGCCFFLEKDKYLSYSNTDWAIEHQSKYNFIGFDYQELLPNTDNLFNQLNESVEEYRIGEQLDYDSLEPGDRVVVYSEDSDIEYEPGTVLENDADGVLIAFDNWNHGHYGNDQDECGHSKCWFISTYDAIFEYIEIDYDQTSDMFNQLNESEIDEFDWVKNLTPMEEPKLSKDGLNLYLTDAALGLLIGSGKVAEVNASSDRYIPYKKMRWGRNGSGSDYLMTVSFKKRGDGTWLVTGSSGDYGWGEPYMTKSHTLGKRVRNQIFKNIISDFQKVIN